MRKYTNLGLKIRETRKTREHTLSHLAGLLHIEPSYLSMIESGRRRPSEETLRILADQYSLDIKQLRILAGYELTGTVNKREEVKFVEINQQAGINNTETSEVKVRVPDNLSVLYSDSAFVTSSPFGLVFDFAQNMGPTNNQNVVSRVGLSIEHAKAFLKILSKKIIDAEKAQEEHAKMVNMSEGTKN